MFKRVQDVENQTQAGEKACLFIGKSNRTHMLRYGSRHRLRDRFRQPCSKPVPDPLLFQLQCGVVVVDPVIADSMLHHLIEIKRFALRALHFLEERR